MSEYDDLRQLLGHVLAPEAFERWLDTPIPKFGGRTPSAMIFDGHLDLVFDLAESYLDPSYG